MILLYLVEVWIKLTCKPNYNFVAHLQT